MSYAYVFGPVMSSRLGLSLGLDLLGARVCTMDCVYCEVGATETLTDERREWVAPELILGELSRWLESAEAMPDYITLGGMGEPGLNKGMGSIIEGVRGAAPGVPVAVLTNATLLAREDVRREMALADAVLPSLDSVIDKEFRRINRPYGGVTPGDVAEGILAFARAYTGKIFLEVLLASGMNDTRENLEGLESFVAGLNPDRVDVVTMTRPGAYESARPVDKDTLEKWRARLGAVPGGGDLPHGPSGARAVNRGDVREMVLSSIRRRPQTASQLAHALGAPEDSVRQVLDELEQAGQARIEISGSQKFYYSGGGR